MHQEEWYEYLRFTKPQQIVIIGFILLNIGIKTMPYCSWYSKINHTLIDAQINLNDPKIAQNTIKSNEFPKGYPSHKTKKKPRGNSNYKKAQKREVNYPDIKKKENRKEVDFKFDPNHLSDDSIQLLNIPQGAKRNWIKYRNSGGQFYSVQSMSKIFGITDNDLAYLEDKIQIKSKNGIKKMKYSTTKIFVNSATSEDWQTIRGIGPYYAKNILKYKESLGGFNNLNQIREVYRLPDSTYNMMIPRLKLDAFKPKYNINLMSQQSLYQHPYITYKQAKLIVKYRMQHGNYNTMDDLANIISLDQSFINKIKPYFIMTTSEHQKNLSSVN